MARGGPVLRGLCLLYGVTFLLPIGVYMYGCAGLGEDGEATLGLLPQWFASAYKALARVSVTSNSATAWLLVLATALVAGASVIRAEDALVCAWDDQVRPRRKPRKAAGTPLGPRGRVSGRLRLFLRPVLWAFGTAACFLVLAMAVARVPSLSRWLGMDGMDCWFVQYLLAASLMGAAAFITSSRLSTFRVLRTLPLSRDTLSLVLLAPSVAGLAAVMAALALNDAFARHAMEGFNPLIFAISMYAGGLMVLLACLRWRLPPFVGFLLVSSVSAAASVVPVNFLLYMLIAHLDPLLPVAEWIGPENMQDLLLEPVHMPVWSSAVVGASVVLLASAVSFRTIRRRVDRDGNIYRRTEWRFSKAQEDWFPLWH